MTSNTNKLTTNKLTQSQEPLLRADDNRYVMFPIQDNSIWNMYKKQIDCFWRAEEIDFSKDLTDWANLTSDERYFISMVLAFFAASDGIVLENLAVRFMGDVQLSEARAFYGFQIAMENIHCVSGDTAILTDLGYFEIESLVDKTVNVWNGIEFSEVTVKFTGNQPIFTVELSNGLNLDCTPGHKWFIQLPDDDGHMQVSRIETQELIVGQTVAYYELPIVDCKDPDEFKDPYMHGFLCSKIDIAKSAHLSFLYEQDEIYDMYISLCGDGYSGSGYLDIDEFYMARFNHVKYTVPKNYSINTKLRWLEGVVDAIGYIDLHEHRDRTLIKLSSIHYAFLKNIQLLLTTLGIHSTVAIVDQIEDSDMCDIVYILTIASISKLSNLGFSPKRLKLLYSELRTINLPETIYITRIQKIAFSEPTFCFNEPKAHAGIFNGILTGQSETYSLMIETYIKDSSEKKRLFEATRNFECIKKKADWAKKWINDEAASFAERLVAFACIEGLFFSSSFASIYWIKKRGLMPGLTFSNQLISRDEALHTEFAVLLYSKLQTRLSVSRINDIIQDAVKIEKEFILDALPCRLIGMNSQLMSQYIEFVADRLLLQLGYDKIYNASNPFDFMELISIESKVNFFERTNSEYALANKEVKGDVFDMEAEF